MKMSKTKYYISKYRVSITLASRRTNRDMYLNSETHVYIAMTTTLILP